MRRVNVCAIKLKSVYASIVEAGVGHGLERELDGEKRMVLKLKLLLE